jgi:hypothetical protein
MQRKNISIHQERGRPTRPGKIVDVPVTAYCYTLLVMPSYSYAGPDVSRISRGSMLVGIK